MNRLLIMRRTAALTARICPSHARSTQATLGHRYSTARISKRPTDESAACLRARYCTDLAWLDLENDLQPELHLPWVERRRDFAEVLRIVGGRHWIIEVRMVERVEKLRAELNLEPLGHLEIPAQCEVKVLDARPDDDVASRGSKRSDRLRLKRGFVEPLFDSLRPGVRIADQVRAVVAVKSVADIPAQQGCERAARLQREDSRSLPPSEDVGERPASEDLVTFAQRNLPDRARHQTMPHVEIGQPSLGAQVERVLGDGARRGAAGRNARGVINGFAERVGPEQRQPFRVTLLGLQLHRMIS